MSNNSESQASQDRSGPSFIDGAESTDLLGGLDVESSDEIKVPDKLLDQVIGQSHARDVIKKAARQRRHVLMIGSPGTGKSMLAKAMTELLPQEDLKDVLVYDNPKDETEPKTRTVESGKGEHIVQRHKEEANRRNRLHWVLMCVSIALVLGYALIIKGALLIGLITAAIVFFLFKFGIDDSDESSPNLLIDNSEESSAPFEDATGSHSGAILGDVRHDPFQSGKMSTPSHERVEPGSIHKAHNGVLFLDEINTLDIEDQQKLMTAIQDGEFAITGQSSRSSGAMVQTEPVPCNFIMVAAGNMDAIENMHPALRDRLKGYGYEVYMDDVVDDTEDMRQKYAQFIAQEVERDGDIPHFTRDAMEEVILEAKRRAGRQGKLTLELRDLGGIVRVAGDIARAEGGGYTTRDHVLQAKERSASIEQQYVDERIERKEEYGVSDTTGTKVGHVNGLAVMGEDSGILLPVIGEVTPAQGPSEIIATGKLQEIAQEAVQNVSAIIKKLGGDDLSERDVHIQFVQTHQGVDGDSASVTVATAVISSLEGIGVKQNVAMTGSLSVRGEVLPVGGVTHKIEAAAKSGMDTVVIPEANKNDVMIEEEFEEQIDIVTAEHLSDVLSVALDADSTWLDSVTQRLRETTEQGSGDAGLGSPTPT